MALIQVFPNRVPANAYAEIRLYGGYGDSGFAVTFNGVASEHVFADDAGAGIRAILPPGTQGETVTVTVTSNGGTFTLANAITRIAPTATSRLYGRYAWETGTTNAISTYGHAACNPTKAAALVAAGKRRQATSNAYGATTCLAQSKQDVSDAEYQTLDSLWQPGALGDAYQLVNQFRYPLTSEVRCAGSTIRAGVWKVLGKVQDPWVSGNVTRLRFCLYIYRPSTGAVVGTIYDDTLDTSNPGPIGFVIGSTARAVNFSMQGAAVGGLAPGDALHLEVWALSTITSTGQTLGPRWYFDGRVDVEAQANGATYSGNPAFCLVAPRVLTDPLVSITSITPNSGPITGGTAVTLAGAGFTALGAVSVQFGGIAATDVAVVDDAHITCTAPAHAAAEVNVTVTVGSASATMVGGFTYIDPAPTISNVSPGSGLDTGGTLVTITGTNFTGASGATFGGSAATAFTVVDDSTITCRTPSHAAGTVNVVVTKGTMSATAVGAFTFIAALTVLGITPGHGPIAGGTQVAITGTAFVDPLTVTFDGIHATGVVVVSPTQILATSPPHGPGSVGVTVVLADGQTATLPFQYELVGSPTVYIPLPDYAGYATTWLEIEGIPYAFGVLPKAASFFAMRADRYRRLGIKGVFKSIPTSGGQEAKPLDGDSSIGALTVSMTEDAGGQVLALLTGTRRTDAWLRLAADLPHVAEADIDVPVNIATAGAVDATLYPASGGVIYVARETITYASRAGNTFQGCKRMRFEVNGHTGCYAHAASDVVTPYPRMVATRTALYRVERPGGSSLARWAGVVKGAQMLDGLVGVELTIDSIDRELRVQRFANQIRGKLKIGIAAPDGSFESSTDALGAAAANTAQLELSSISGRDWTGGERIIFRVADEYFSGRLGALGSGTIQFDDIDDARGLFNSLSGQHAAGDELKEVIFTGGYQAAGSPEECASRFTRGDNPLYVALQFLLSRRGDGANGYFDVLPYGWGIGIDQARVDTSAILLLADSSLPGARHLELIEEPFNAKQLLADVLKPHLCYLVTSPDDRTMVQRLAPLLPGDPVRTVNANNITALPSWDGNLEEACGRVVWRCDYDPVVGEYRQKFTYELTDAQELYAGAYRTITVDAKGQWTGNDASTGRFGSSFATDAELAARRYADEIRARYSLPPPLLSVECDYDMVDIAVGSKVVFTLDNVPNVETGGRGLLTAICEVISKNPYDDQAKVELIVMQTGYRGAFRPYAPCARVSGVAGAVLAVDGHEYSNPMLSKRDADFFPVGTVVSVWDPDMRLPRGEATITGTGVDQIALSAMPAGVQVGDIVMPAYNPAAADTSGFLGLVAFFGHGHVYTG